MNNDLYIKVKRCADATITLDSEPFLTVASGSTTNITLEDEDGNPVDPIGSDGSAIIVPNSTSAVFDMEINVNGTLVDTLTLDSSIDNIININA